VTDAHNRRPHRGLVLLVWVALLFLIMPLVVIVPVSFTPNRYLSFPGETWSLRHYQVLFSDPSWRSSAADSLIVALGASALATTLGTCCAVGCWRISSRLSELIRLVMLAPIIVPSIVHALGFYRAWIEFGLYNSYQGLIIAHAMKGTPYVIICASAALANFDVRLEQAARNLGASTGQAIRWVVLPSIAPGILAGAGFAFVTSWDELVVNLFVISRGVLTLPRKIWISIQDNIDPAVAAVATLLILVTLAGIVVNLVVARRAAARLEGGAS
jgi:putative spermidine/putrescine transport system permease protein